MIIAYKNMNRFNETRLTVVVDTDNKTVHLYHGQAAPIVRKKASMKKIETLYEVFAAEPNYTATID